MKGIGSRMQMLAGQVWPYSYQAQVIVTTGPREHVARRVNTRTRWGAERMTRKMLSRAKFFGELASSRVVKLEG